MFQQNLIYFDNIVDCDPPEENFTIYITINLVNGKMYAGKSKNITKYYLGSGKILKQAIALYIFQVL